MKLFVISLFPQMFDSPFKEGMIKRAIDKKIIELNCHQMRQWAWNSYQAVDDRPYGGGVGMLIRVDVIDKALKEIKKNPNTKVILTSAKGKEFTQRKAEEWSKVDNLIFICGRYEGFDERVVDLVDEEVSIGKYVLTGGELPTMVMIDAVTRLLPGVLGKDESSLDESFAENIDQVEYPQYTRPAEYLNKKVPEVLLSGDPKKIKEWQESKKVLKS